MLTANYQGRRVQVVGDSHTMFLNLETEPGHYEIVPTSVQMKVIKELEDTCFYGLSVPETELSDYLEMDSPVPEQSYIGQVVSIRG